MRHKTLAISFLLGTTLLVGAGCTSPTPEDKVEALQADKAENLETSGYNECVIQVDARIDARKQCISDKLVAGGYTDGIDCIQDYENPICEFARYNAQVDANNECNEQFNDPTALTQLDCLELLVE